MNVYRLFPVLLLFAYAVPSYGQVQPQARVGSLLQAVSDALDHYQQLAPGIHCEDATEKTLGDSCKVVLEMLGRDAQDAKEKIARYHQLSNPQLINLFDMYQVLEQIMAGIGNLGCAAESYGEHNRVLFAEAYNSFVKIDGWFRNEMRDAIQETEKRCDRRDARQTSLDSMAAQNRSGAR
jgi:hypothetical protein